MRAETILAHMSRQTENIIYAHDTLEFVAVCTRFCAVLEQCEKLTQEEFVRTLLTLLPLLYMKRQMLPEVDADVAFMPDAQVTEDDYNYVRDSAYRLLQGQDAYEILARGDDMQTEATRWCSVSEGLADMYQALRNFVAVYQQRIESCMPAALWQVCEDFELFWGQTLLDTLGQLHRIRYNMNTSEDEENC